MDSLTRHLFQKPRFWLYKGVEMGGGGARPNSSNDQKLTTNFETTVLFSLLILYFFFIYPCSTPMSEPRSHDKVPAPTERGKAVYFVYTDSLRIKAIYHCLSFPTANITKYCRLMNIFSKAPFCHDLPYGENWAHISEWQTPGSTRGLLFTPPLILYNKCGVNPGLNPGFSVLRCGPWARRFGVQMKLPSWLWST
jgi:hypothetical protein